MRQSQLSCYQTCPHKYYITYIEHVEVIPSQDAAEARTIGTAMHLSAEHGLEYAKDWYYSQYYVITDAQINEVLKLEILYPKLKAVIDSLGTEVRHEIFWEYADWTGTADLLVDNHALYDFKYSNNIDYYLKSAQLHIYQYFMNQSGYEINRLGFIFIPKTQIRQKKTEELREFRQRIEDTLNTMEIQVKYIEYDPSQITKTFELIETIKKDTKFEKNTSKLCSFCDYEQLCKSKEV